MNGIEVLLKEHENIQLFIAAAEKICCGILEGAPVDEALFRDMICFGQNYADQYHHQKEEQILFREMSAQLGPVAEKLIQHGMLVEHDLGRLHLSELKAALERYCAEPNTLDKLQMLTELTGYTNLLKRHIEKENNAVYLFGQRSLSKETLAQIDRDTEAFEIRWAEKREESLRFLERLMEIIGLQ